MPVDPELRLAVDRAWVKHALEALQSGQSPRVQGAKGVLRMRAVFVFVCVYLCVRVLCCAVLFETSNTRTARIRLRAFCFVDKHWPQ